MRVLKSHELTPQPFPTSVTKLARKVVGKNQQKTRDRVCRIWNEQGRPKGGGWDHWQHAENQQIANGKDDSTKGDDNWKIEAGNPILTERGNKSLKFMVYDRVII